MPALSASWRQNFPVVLVYEKFLHVGQVREALEGFFLHLLNLRNIYLKIILMPKCILTPFRFKQLSKPRNG